jgi:hypothetical protein
VHCFGIDHSVNEAFLRQLAGQQPRGGAHARTPAKTGFPGNVKPTSYHAFVAFSVQVFDEFARLNWPRLTSRENPRAARRPTAPVKPAPADDGRCIFTVWRDGLAQRQGGGAFMPNSSSQTRVQF